MARKRPATNETAWDRISAAYQARYRLPEDRLAWGVWCPDESELRLLRDVRGARAVVLGCGGGQDCVALARMGAAQVTGIDPSREQLAHARRLLAKHGVKARLLRTSAEDLAAIPSASQDLVVSIHALNYVEDIHLCFAEVFRVLMPGGLLAFSVQHPMDAMTDDDPPYTPIKPYHAVEVEWEWQYPEADLQAGFRSWFRTAGEWFNALAGAGFRVERLLEPPPPERPPENGFEERYPIDKARIIPQTLIFTARKLGEG